MTLNNEEQIKYIEENFHQYFDLTLNTNITTTENVNLVIPIETLTAGNRATTTFTHDKNYQENYNIEEIFQKYQNTTIIEEDTNNCAMLNGLSSISQEININSITKKDELFFYYKSNGEALFNVFLEKYVYDKNIKKYQKISIILFSKNINSENWTEFSCKGSQIINEFSLLKNKYVIDDDKFNLVFRNDSSDKNIFIDSILHKNSYNSALIKNTDFNENLQGWTTTGSVLIKKYNLDVLTCVCDEVIDGDTIVVKIPYEFKTDNNITIKYKKETVRFVGINTPEENQTGYDVSKEFVEKACFSKNYFKKIKKIQNNETLTEQEENINNDKKIQIKVDNKNPKDQYNRLLALVIVDGKNLNEILLKEGIAEIMYMPPSEFNPYDWSDINTSVHVYNFINDDINVLSPYLNADLTNIAFTPKNNNKVLYKFEVYKNVIYVKLNPFSKNIRMHLLPKYYDCSNKVLFFTDNMITEDDITISNDYKCYSNQQPINSYYQINDMDRDRNNPDLSNENYNVSNWTNTFCNFEHDISKDTINMNNVQICAGYRYNNTTPFYSVHFTGIKDNTTTNIEDRCVLIDANFDKISTKSNNITQFYFDENNNLYVPKSPVTIRKEYGDNNHVSEVGKLFHKKIKYINDTMYAEENKTYGSSAWIDLSD